MKKVIDSAEGTVTFTFDDGLEPVVLREASLSAENRKYAVLHGMAARLGDAAAIQKTAENGFRVTEAMRREEVAKMAGFYANPGNVEWNVKVRSARAAAPNPVFLVLAGKLGCSYEEAMARVAAMDIEMLRNS